MYCCLVLASSAVRQQGKSPWPSKPPASAGALPQVLPVVNDKAALDPNVSMRDEFSHRLASSSCQSYGLRVSWEAAAVAENQHRLPHCLSAFKELTFPAQVEELPLEVKQALLQCSTAYSKVQTYLSNHLGCIEKRRSIQAEL